MGSAGLLLTVMAATFLLSAVLLLNDVVTLLAFAIVTRELVARVGAAGYVLAFAISLPVLIAGFAAQDKLVQGLSLGAVK